MIAVIGGGCWATAIVKILLDAGQRTVGWWVRSDEVCKGLSVSGRNLRHLTSLQFDPNRLKVNTNLSDVVATSDTLVLAVPSVHIADLLAQLPPSSYHGKRFVSAIKGYVPQYRLSISQYIEQHLHVTPDVICIISGPSHAEEVADGKATFLTVASTNPQLANEIATTLTCSYIHTSVSNDVHAIELCGLSKNVYAVAAGLTAGLGYGDNLTAVLTSAAAHELQDIIPDTTLTFKILSDLIVTCFSHHSRNRALGEAVASGMTPDEYFRQSGMVAEGYYSAAVMHDMATPCPTPIADAVFQVLHLGADPRKCIDNLIDNVL